MALNFLVDSPLIPFQVLFCIDSKSVLQALKSFSIKVRGEIVIEIRHMIHFLSLRGTSVTFCWIPSHCGFYGNECADRLAKAAAKEMDINSTSFVNIPYSLQEGYHLLEKTSWNHVNKLQKCSSTGKINRHISCYTQVCRCQNRLLTKLMYRLKLDALRTKFCKNVMCICGSKLSPRHVILQCELLEPCFPRRLTDRLLKMTFDQIISDKVLLLDIVKVLVRSPVGNLL